MATTYAAYANILDQQRRSTSSSQSSMHSTSQTQQQQSSSRLHRLLDSFKPLGTPQRQTGIYTPVIRHGDLFEGFADAFKPVDEAQVPVGMYRPIIKERDLFSSRKNSAASSRHGSVGSARAAC